MTLQRADRASAVLAIVGVINVPIIHYSVVWWNTLASGAATVTKMAAPTISTSMLVPLLMMILGFTLYFVAMLLVRVRGEVLQRERNALLDSRGARMNIAEFIDMGGYAAFVWPAYAVALAVLIGNLVAARASHRRAVSKRARRAGEMGS